MLFKLQNIGVSFSEKQIFDKLQFIFNQGDKVGIIGDNGVGKSTLFNIIRNTIHYSGEVIFENNNFGYLSQDESFFELELISNRKKEIEDLLLKEEIINDSEKYNELLNEYNELVSNSISQEEDYLISRFNFNEELYNKEKKENLSGGEGTKLKLIKLFSQHFDYYLLDEPTNHLDIHSKNTLIDLLENVESYVIISHDIDLLNKCCNKIGEINNHTISMYIGNYDNYLEFKEKEKEEVFKKQTESKKEKKKIKETISNIKSASSQKVKEKTQDFGKGQVLRNMGNGRGGMESALREVSKKINKLEDKYDSIEDLELNKEENLKIKYLEFSKPNHQVLHITNLEKSFDKFKLRVKNFTIYCEEKIALQGNNGSGKSTFLKLITQEISQDRGEIIIGDRVKIGYLSQKNVVLNLNNTVLNEILELNVNIDEGEIRKYLGKLLFKKNDVFKLIKNLSGGEKTRLGILKLILQGSNFLILDEPSNHLDIKSKEILAQALDEFQGSILVVSHDDHFLDTFVSKKIQIENGSLN